MSKRKINKIEPIVLLAKKVKVSTGPYKGFHRTELYQGGKLKAVIPASQSQPRRGQKSIILNGWKFALKWK